MWNAGNSTSYGLTERDSTDIASLIETTFDLVVVKYTSAAGFVVYLYDIFLTFDDEIALFWNSSGSSIMIKLLYLTNRYLPMMGLISTIVLLNDHSLNKISCQFNLLGSIICQVFAAIATAAIFSLRVLTIYQSSSTVRALIIFSFWVSVLALLILLFMDLAWMGPYIVSLNGICIVDSDFSKSAYAAGGLYLAPLFCELVVMGATVRHALDTRRNRKTLQLSRASPVLRRLYKDGFVYFFLVFSLRIMTCLVWFLAPSNLKYSCDYFGYSLTSVVTSRFFLGLRRSINQSITLTDAASNSIFTTDGFGGPVYFATPIVDVSLGTSSWGNKGPFEVSQKESMKTPDIEMPMEGIRRKSSDESLSETRGNDLKRPQPP